MSSLRKLAALILVASLGCSPAPESQTEEDREALLIAEVTATMEEMKEAMDAFEPERVMAFYTDAPEFLALTCTSFIQGGARFKAMVGPTYGADRATTREQNIVSTQLLSPTVAVVTQEGSSSRAPYLFYTRVLVKEGGRWLISYEHQSWPGCSAPAEPHPSLASPNPDLPPLDSILPDTIDS